MALVGAVRCEWFLLGSEGGGARFGLLLERGAGAALSQLQPGLVGPFCTEADLDDLRAGGKSVL